MTKKDIPDWKLCEDTKRLKYSEQGCFVVPTGKGSDFLAICPDKKSTFVEVKKGCQPLTELQRKTMAEVASQGLGYVVERCNCIKAKKVKM